MLRIMQEMLSCQNRTRIFPHHTILYQEVMLHARTQSTPVLFSEKVANVKMLFIDLSNQLYHFANVLD